MHEVLAKLMSYLRAMWLRRWYAVIAAWLIAIVGWTWVYITPNRYEATARVYIDTQTILKPLLAGLTVAPNMDQTVSMMTRTLISRPNMEKLARMTDLDVRAKTPKETEALLDGLASDIKLGVTRGDDLYTISYQNRDPEVAKRVVQSLLTILVEGSLGSKRKDTDSAKRFLDDQLKAYEEKLVSAENALKDFKQKHVGLMPGEGGDYFAKLATAQQALSEAQLALREAQSRRDQLKRQLADQEADDTKGGDDAVVAANPELDARIQDLQKRLDQLRLVYTDRHPDVVATKRLIEQLEKQKRDEAKLRKPTAASAGASTNPFYQQLGISLADAEANVASMQARVNELSSRLAQLKAAVNMVPQVEADLTQLNRDYEVNKANYEQLLKRRESAEISGEMESKTDVIDFRVVDPPRVPSKPAFPNRPLLISLVLLGALGAGIALSFVVSQIIPVVPDRVSLKDLSDYPILGSVSMVWNDTQKRQRKRGLVAYAASVASLLGAYGLLMTVIALVGRGA
jgi:polysaccharide chain length determinant protein (PEP-CTERM system associated)